MSTGAIYQYVLTVTLNCFDGREFNDVEIRLDQHGKFEDVIILAADECGIRPDDVSSLTIAASTWLASKE